MHIVVIGLRGFPRVPGGIETHCEKLYPRIVSHGYAVTVLARRPYVSNHPYEFKGVRIFPVWTVANKYLETIIHTALCCVSLKRFSPDIVHFHGIGPSLFIPWCKKKKYHVVATHHGFDYDRAKWGQFARLFLRAGERRLCTADAIISISSQIEQSLQSRFGRLSYTIPNGVEVPELAPAGNYVADRGLFPGRYFFFAGRVVPEKCLDDLLVAYSKISTSWKLVIAGDADHPDSYTKKIRRLAAHLPGVVLAGYLRGNELHEIFSNAGCFILPSSHEGLPIALLEALGYGLPCIVSNISAHQSIHNENIHLFPVHDIDILSSYMSNVSIGALPHSRDSARQFVSTHYNWDTIASLTLQAYKKST
jgi:glycosyltransferase involved in cell wall biosynthesis